MSETVVYRHICGYPLEEGSELTRCPGCGERITPWNVNIATESFPSEAGGGDRMQTMLRWLVERSPDLAEALQALLAAEVSSTEGDVVQALDPAAAQREALQVAYTILNRALRRGK